MPSKPHSLAEDPGRAARSRRGTGTPSTSQYAGITLAIPDRRTAASNGNSCSSRSSRSPMCAGAWFRPPSASPWPTMCLAVASDALGEVGALERLDVGAAELGGEVRVLAVRLLDPAPARVASDVEDRARGRAGRRSAASAGGSSRPIAATTSGSKLAAAPIDCWKHGAAQAMQAVQAFLVDDRRDPEPRPLDAGSRWIALAVCATSTGRRLVEPASRLISPMPSPARAASRASSNPVSGTTSNAQNEPSWATFSARVIRAEQVGDARLDRERRVAVAGLDRRHQPFTDPAVRPPTMWRSAMR